LIQQNQTLQPAPQTLKKNPEGTTNGTDTTPAGAQATPSGEITFAQCSHTEAPFIRIGIRIGIYEYMRSHTE